MKWIQGIAVGIDVEKQLLLLENLPPMPYDKICICTGSKPRRLLNSPHALVLRDTDSVKQLAQKLESARKVVIVGNGGIALELAYVSNRISFF